MSAGRVFAVAAIIVAAAGAGYALKQGWSGAQGKSLAVLPFTNLSEDKLPAYFADGMHGDLLTQLALLGGLRVTARTSVMDYRNTTKPPGQIGAELGVESLLEGSVGRDGNRIRVTARLIDVKSAKPLWAKSYDRELKDLFAMQDELAADVARSLEVRGPPRAEKKPTQNLAAYDFYLREKQLDEGALFERIELLSEAVAFDPSFGLAWARLASAQARAPARLAKAKQAFERAQALAPGDLRAKLEYGHYYVDALQDLARAAKTFEEVLDAAPGSVDALLGLARVRALQRQWGERAALLERALALDPRNVATLTRLSAQYQEFRRWDRASALLRQAAALRPGEPALQAEIARVEYLRTGSWAAFDEWRSRLPASAAACCLVIRDLDFSRALARRAFAAAARLTDVETDDMKAAGADARGVCRELERALVLRAAGDGQAAAKTVHQGLQKAQDVAPRDRDGALLSCKAQLHAAAGQRLMAIGTPHAELDGARLSALLGERKEALATLGAQLRQPGTSGYEVLTDVALASLWDDADFRRLANDPASNGPVSFDVRP